MSGFAKTWAWEQPDLNPTERCVLVGLADFHTEDKGCFPSLKSIAEKVCVSIDTVHRTIDKLIEKGLVEKINRFREEGGKTSNSYNLLLTDIKVPMPQSADRGTRNLRHEHKKLEQDTIPTELEDDPVMSIFANAEEPPEDNPKAFWDQAVGMLQALHVSPKTINPFIGRCLKMTGQDQERVLDAIQAAVDAEPHDAVPYIVAILGGKKERKTARFEKTAKQKEIEDAFAQLEAASERRKAQWAAEFGEDYTGTGGGEDLPIVQHQPPSESVSVSGKRSEGARKLSNRGPAQVSRSGGGYFSKSEVPAHYF